MSKRILILGSGYISSSVIHFFMNKNYQITVGSLIQKELDNLSKMYEKIKTKVLDITKDEEILETLIGNCNLVISLLPNHMHLPVVIKCIQKKVNLISASYCTPEINALDNLARDAGVLILNEIGLDPGIDHFLAMKCIDEIHEAGGSVVSFVSYCGGLPAPSCRDNPLQYKFSWSPKTALANLLNGASYLKNGVVGNIVEIPSGGCLIDETKNMDFLTEFDLEGHPNRNSIIYKDLYSIPEAQTIIRGTLRYRGFSEAVKHLHKIGLLSNQPISVLNNKNESENPVRTWRQLIATLLGIEVNVPIDILKSALKNRLQTDKGVKIIESLGLLSEKSIKRSSSTPLDALSNFLAETLRFEDGEMDIVILRHEITAEYHNNSDVDCGTIQEFREVDFIVYGDSDNGFTAMAKTVSCSIGIASEMILNGEIQQTGVLYPFTQDIYSPILKKLAEHGFTAKERISSKYN